MDGLRSDSLSKFALPGLCAGSRAHYAAAVFHPTTTRLFLLVGAYVACPLIDIPLLGVSLSAPLMYLVGLEVFLRPPERWLRDYRRWVAFAVAIWLGVFYSAMFNGIAGTGINISGLARVFRYGYWVLVVFLVTVYLVSRGDLGARVLRAMVYALVVSALLRWFEAIAWGKIGAWTGTRIFTQNGYGHLFSAFTPLLLARLVEPTTKGKGLILIATLVVGSAAAINGSRGSWVALAVAIAVFALLCVVAYPGRIKAMAWGGVLALALLALVTLAPERAMAPVSERYATLQHLGEVKTVASRQLMVQKGLKLFCQSPIFGVGPARWREVAVPLDIPNILRQDQGYYNRKTAHNSYIYILAETGLVGAVPVGAFLLYLAVQGGLATVAITRQGALWALGLYAGFVGMSVHFWVLGGMTGTAPWLMYGLVAATIVAHERRMEAQGEE